MKVIDLKSYRLLTQKLAWEVFWVLFSQQKPLQLWIEKIK